MIKNPATLLVGRAWWGQKGQCHQTALPGSFRGTPAVASGGEACNLSKAKKVGSALYLFTHSRNVVPIFLKQQIVIST